MICVVSTWPSGHKLKEGMLQRVAHIDSLMASAPRNYLDISFRRFLRKEVRTEGLATVYCLNFFVHALLILRLLRAARTVYVHSAYNALRMMVFPTRARIIFDAHGVVPEECAQQGQAWYGRFLSVAEGAILRRCHALVCVTQSMLAHFQQKHGRRPGREELILPILPQVGDSGAAAQALQAGRHADAVIYAGGMQPWQNVDRMVAAAARRPELRYTFLTGELAPFEARLRAGGVRSFACESVAPERVKDYYLSHTYGFVLRDETLVNLVACPTKLVEYLYWGVLPVVITPRIGDFDAASLRAVTLEQFLRGELPDAAAAAEMRRHNQTAVLALIASAQRALRQVQELLLGAGQAQETGVSPSALR
ncbi:hypothetical protein GCM10028796_37640 [Ramlibacter monticola]|uniref:Glycosyltransferase n=1 Tax=Ramlibacter monticola TaxID=1926872 RepID=A0A936ZB14_9BURK|nr:glycosyltransferase [Ramlibacter monticola]MBL0395035.1 hypothetical protein [Ramlibacter monticola]